MHVSGTMLHCVICIFSLFCVLGDSLIHTKTSSNTGEIEDSRDVKNVIISASGKNPASVQPVAGNLKESSTSRKLWRRVLKSKTVSIKKKDIFIKFRELIWKGLEKISRVLSKPRVSVTVEEKDDCTVRFFPVFIT